jgi:hypothetical protein
MDKLKSWLGNASHEAAIAFFLGFRLHDLDGLLGIIAGLTNAFEAPR